MKNNNKLTIIIVNWNTKELTINCVKSINYNHLNGVDIIVVDNASSDGSVELFEDIYKLKHVIYNNENYGYARANNKAISISNSEYICLLNSDTEVLDNSIQQLIDFMDTHPGVMACSPALRLPNGKLQSSAGGFKFNVLSAFNHFLFLSKIKPLLFKGMYLDQTPMVKSGKPIEVDWLCGACLVVRKSAIDQVGALDDSYFMYAEDVEWCDRLRTLGKIMYLPYIEIIHYFGASTDKNKVNLKWLEAMFKYYRARSIFINYILFRFIIGVGLLFRYLFYSVLSSVRFSPDLSRTAGHFRAYFSYALFNRGGVSALKLKKPL